LGDTRDLSLILDSGIAIVSVESPDEKRVLSLLLQLAMKRGMPFFEWTATRGVRRGGVEAKRENGAEHADPEALLRHIAATEGPALYALCDLHPYIASEPRIIRHLKDIALDYDRLGNTLVLVSHTFKVPPELGRLTASFQLRLPSDEELLAMVRSEAQAWARQNEGRKVQTDTKTLDKLIASLRGVTHADAEVLIRRTIFEDGVIDDGDIPGLNRLKFHLMDTEGVLHYEHSTESFANVAGLQVLKAWLDLRRKAVLRPGGKDRPKGVLLLGVQGAAKVSPPRRSQDSTVYPCCDSTSAPSTTSSSARPNAICATRCARPN
jgi:hypothetical protein